VCDPLWSLLIYLLNTVFVGVEKMDPIPINIFYLWSYLLALNVFLHFHSILRRRNEFRNSLSIDFIYK
jgi:hypothetical protein